MRHTKRALLLNPRDNVAVALTKLEPGDMVEVRGGVEKLVIRARDEIPFGHKIAIRDIPRCGYVVKYGYPIGRAKRDIRVGEHVHLHNLESLSTIRSVCGGG